MRASSPLLPAALLAALLMLASAAVHAAVGGEATAQRPADPFAPVFVVASRDTFQRYIRPHARESATRFDSTGRPLVVARLAEHQLAGIGRELHAAEQRCGGYFAFATRAEAEAFIRSDRSRQALQATAAPAYSIDNAATVEPWLSQPSEARIHDTIAHLSRDRPNRYFSTSHGRNAALWIRDTWQAIAAGRDDVTVELFTACASCSTQPSVILTIDGNELADEIVVLGGHLDSTSNSGAGEFMNAPGADDDASGIATLTEVLKVALDSGWRPRRTVKFMAYAAEEVGLRGSQSIASSFASQGLDVHGVLQLDMTNYRAGPVPDMRLVTDYSSPALKDFMAALFDTYLAPLGLTRGLETCGYACSDHASWTAAGYPAGMMFEAGDPAGYFPYIHTRYDDLAFMDESAQNSVKFARFGLAFLGEMAKTSFGVVPKLPDCDGRVEQVPALRAAAAPRRFLQSPVVRDRGSMRHN